MRTALLATLALLATGCRDSPREVLEAASEAAASEDLATVKSAFSVTTVQRLERHWRQESTSDGAGWKALSGLLLDTERAQLEIGAEEIHGDYARVMAKAGVTARPYFLRKEDGRWRLELGAGMRFREAQKAATPETEGKDEAKKK